MICLTSTIESYTTDLQSRGTNYWDTLYLLAAVRFFIFSWSDLHYVNTYAEVKSLIYSRFTHQAIIGPNTKWYYAQTGFIWCTNMSTLGSRGFSCAISGFGQVLKSDPREEDMFEDTKPSKNHGSKATQFLKEKHFQYRQY